MSEQHDYKISISVSLRKIILIMALTAIGAAIAALGVTALLVNIFERKQEAKNPFFRVVELNDQTEDPALWGKDFPFQYDGYLKTTDQVRTRFGGSEALPRTPTQADPRKTVARSRLDLEPRLKTMWAGYAFSIDYRERRGHAYMLDDQSYTERQKKPQYGNCIQCHASNYVENKKLGGGDLVKGFEKMCAMPYKEARKLVTHPIACIDCHDPATMQLRISRPAFMQGIKALKEHEGVKDYDVNTMATRQEMRSFVCAQCHVNYVLPGEKQGRILSFPWNKGVRGDEEQAYLDEIKITDWTHAITSATCQKARHPEFELWRQGIHARSGVACADCHMPYKRVGSLKISDHHVQSPLLNVNNACQTCHRFPESELKARVERIQNTTAELQDLSLNALMDLIAGIKAAMDAGTANESLAASRDWQRKAQFLIDFINAENSMGFHAPQESARLMAIAMDYCRRGQNALAAPKPAKPTP
ncbi:MAG: ammonia-forming cytochrome c nitrite reductase subunit c552 [Candidatus Sumerlaeota bacterium]|nr:ammonia-forming cytochrome c nitrite reductase subunit c552 [Candidatus Sumerlaeota bacterium]